MTLCFLYKNIVSSLILTNIIQGCTAATIYNIIPIYWSRHGRDRMVVGFKTSYAIIAYRH